MAVHLPVVRARGSLRADGSRARIIPADVTGRFTRLRRAAFALQLAIGLAMPWITIRGNPAVWLDVPGRRFFLFGATFNAQDTWLMVLLFITIGVSLIAATAMLGRAWCGWSCPQTVLLEGIFRPIERLLEGSREARLRRDAAGFSAGRTLRKLVKHASLAAMAIFLGHVIAAFFVTPAGLLVFVRLGPSAHPEAFGWVVAISALLYLDMAFFREQICVFICPYGRLQSVLLDPQSLIIGYDEKRGEPRGKAADASAGACVDCGRCVVVCPTGIDIRDGLQLDCIACTQCIDACDDIMDRLGRPRGLIRLDSEDGLDGGKTRLLRPRTVAYSLLFCAALGATIFTVGRNATFEANLLRQTNLPFVVEGGVVRNAFRVHLVNKRSVPVGYTLKAVVPDGVTVVMPMPTVRLDALTGADLPMFVMADAATLRGQFPVKVRIEAEGDALHGREVTAPFLGPSAPASPPR